MLLLVKNPAGANEALRTLGANADGAAAAAGAERPHRRRPRRLLDLGRRLRDGPARTPRRVVCSGTRAADIALRAKYAGVDATTASRSCAGRADALDRALERAGAGGTAYVLPTYTAMLELQRLAAARGLARPYWEAAAT